MLFRSTTQLFFALGQAERLTKDATLQAHKDYTKATPEQQSQLRHDCLVQFIMGYTQCSSKAAERILSQSRDERSKQAQDAYYKGSSKFSYHIIRPTKGDAPATRKARISKHTRDAAETFLAEFEGETLAKQIDAAIAVLRAMR